MSYFYERWWGRISWGKTDDPEPVSWRGKLVWAAGTAALLGLIFYLLLVVTPQITGK